MSKQDFTMFSIYITTICLSAIALVFLAPQSGQAVTLMLTVPSLLLWIGYGLVTKGERK